VTFTAIQAFSRSFILALFDRSHYDFRSVFHCNYVSI